MNSGPLEKQSLLLTFKPSLQLSVENFNVWPRDCLLLLLLLYFGEECGYFLSLCEESEANAKRFIFYYIDKGNPQNAQQTFCSGVKFYKEHFDKVEQA